jgi:hypothetical protein
VNGGGTRGSGGAEAAAPAFAAALLQPPPPRLRRTTTTTPPTTLLRLRLQGSANKARNCALIGASESWDQGRQFVQLRISFWA